MSGSAEEPSIAAGELKSMNRTLLKKLVVIVLVMFGFGFLLVPFYEKICQATGLRNIAAPDPVRNTQVDSTRVVRIEFDSNLRKLPWTFRPLETVATINPGELRQVMYEISNTSGTTITGQAIPSYAPAEAAQYFRKLDCFCFTAQKLQPGEVRQMPVVFVVDPELPMEIATITLSYTFFEIEGGKRN